MMLNILIFLTADIKILKPIFPWLMFAALISPGVGSELAKETIHNNYNDGNFEKVIQDIKSFQKENQEYSREDSVFIAKHFSVVYTANPDTRELGKYYMHLLLQLLPKAELVDMFVSDEIDRIFQKVRKEFLIRQGSFGVEPDEITTPEKAPATSAPKEKTFLKNKRNWALIGGGTLVAGALAWIILTEDSPEPEEKRYVVPAEGL